MFRWVLQVSHLPDILDANAPKEPIGKVQSIVQELLVIQGEEDSKDPAAGRGMQHNHGACLCMLVVSKSELLVFNII